VLDGPVAPLKQRLTARGRKLPWDAVARGLSRVRTVTVEPEGLRCLLRTPVQGRAGKVFQAVGVQVPPFAQPL